MLQTAVADSGLKFRQSARISPLNNALGLTRERIYRVLGRGRFNLLPLNGGGMSERCLSERDARHGLRIVVDPSSPLD